MIKVEKRYAVQVSDTTMLNSAEKVCYKKILLFSFWLLLFSIVTAQPKPSPQQLAWHGLEYYWFIHFGPNTFTDVEWGHGNEKEEVFNPTKLDCNQWCRLAKASGATQIIITAKHHDGFCLWPSNFSKHTVRESKWRNGTGDVVKELSAACKKYGLKFGVYISPWDRNHPDYGAEKYNDVFVNMMKELLTNYGYINELWWDGANGEGPNGKKQVYDWKRFRETVKTLSPNTVVFSDVGPDIRWCGNENGFAGETNYNNLSTDGFEPGEKAPATSILNSGEENGKNYIPAECDVSIRPGWFYHKAEDAKVKTPEQLFSIYLKSVGRGANLLLNIPPTPDGLIHKNDSIALMGFKKLRSESFKKNIAVNGKGYFVAGWKSIITTNLNDKRIESYISDSLNYTKGMGIEFVQPSKINCIAINENLTDGQQVKSFTVILVNDKNKTEKRIEGSTIRNKRIITFPSFVVNRVALKINEQINTSKICEIEAYLINDKLIEK